MDLEATTRRLAITLRVLREARGLSIGALARRARLSKSTVSTIESGEANPSLEVLWRLSGALSVPLGTLLGVEAQRNSIVIRAGEGALFESTSGVRGRLLAASDHPHRTEVLYLDFMKGVDYHAEGHASGTEEFVYGIEGTIQVGPTGREVTLEAGDAAQFPADTTHRYYAPTGAKALLVMSYHLAAH
ncbi:MAG: helix-turn-helix domain-containing protein [Ktedonobacterales bacterium]